MTVRNGWIAVAAAWALLNLTPVARAQEMRAAVPTEEAQDTGPGKHSINFSPIGIIFGAYKLNYEYLYNGTHGLLAEGAFGYASDDDVSVTTFGGGAGYRWHWRGRQNSGFLGANLGYQGGSATVTVNDSEFDLDASRFIVVANVGKRWAWDFGLNITFRLGAGYGSWDFSTDSSDPDAREAVQNAEDIVELIPIALDGELSLGWIF